MVDVKVCAIDATWSGLKLVYRLKSRRRPKRIAARVPYPAPPYLSTSAPFSLRSLGGWREPARPYNRRMADADLRARADERFARALEAAGARDPRDFYRKQMVAAQGRRRGRIPPRRGAVLEQELIPAVARDDSDPMGEWLEYGRFLATLAAPGRTVQIDAEGRASRLRPPRAGRRARAPSPRPHHGPRDVVGIPTTLSPAQRASYDLLVKQAQSL